MKGDPAPTRLRHWTRWRLRRASDAWRHQAHLDVLSDDARATWLCSWQRSGSTWVAEVLASAPRTRLIYEPANVPSRLFTGEAAALQPLADGPGPELEAVERALHGRVHGSWVDQLATGHVAARRVVKDVRAMGLLGLVTARHPSTPVVVLVRHPLAVARSAVALGWTHDRGAPLEVRLLDEVRRWADVHAAALSEPASARAMVVCYEHLVAEPGAILDALLAHLARHHPTWRGLAVDRGRLDQPSSTNFRGTAGGAPSEWIGTFDDLDQRVVDRAARILRDAGLGRLYGASPLPILGPDELRDALPAR